VKETYAKLIFVLLDIVMIFLAIILAYTTRHEFSGFFSSVDSFALANYTTFYPLYFITIILFAYEGIYTHRYDLWHESKVILKSLFFSLLIVLSYLAMTKNIENYSRAVIVFTFFFAALLVPTSKYFIKKTLFRLGLWQRRVKVYGNDPFLSKEIYNNHYLGYIDAKEKKPKTVFVNSHSKDLAVLKKIIDKEIAQRHEVIFIPLMDDYDLTHSHIYKLSNTRTNLVVFKNRLKSKYRLYLKQASDFCMTLIVLPLISPILLFIAYKIRQEEPGSSILFKQERLGQNGEVFVCYKFRSMYENGNEILQDYLSEHPEEVAFYNTYHKYQNDPRITKIGHFLRKTSLDELPQIFNVLKNEMSFIGPRPYMINEKEKMGPSVETVLSVKPGITGLWQVSGRSDVDFHSRVKLDVWYVRNWNLWMDFEILVKTIKTVLKREGAS